MAEFSVNGGDQIARVLKALPIQYQKRALYNAFKAGAEIVAEEARNNATRNGLPQFAADIVIGKPTRRQRLSKDTIAIVAMKKAHSGWAHIFEFGTKERFRHGKNKKIKKAGARRGRTGRITARPFMRPALDAKGQAAINMIAKITRENIATIVGQMTRGDKISLRRKR